jgi:hypothetical protein
VKENIEVLLFFFKFKNFKINNFFDRQVFHENFQLFDACLKAKKECLKHKKEAELKVL